MGRLIDADALIEILRNNTSKDIQAQIITENNINLIYSMPTAYDVEKVVAELEKAFPINPYPNEFTNGRNLGIKKAIDIVKRGGADGKI